MSDFNNKLVIDLFEERDALKADVVRLTLKVAELYKGAEEQKQRIQRLEEAGDALLELCEADETKFHLADQIDARCEAWLKAKEAK